MNTNDNDKVSRGMTMSITDNMNKMKQPKQYGREHRYRPVR